MGKIFRPFPKIAYGTIRTTGYYPTPDDNSTPENRLEGGPVDMLGYPLNTLQDYLDGKASYVSAAMDRCVPYGALFALPDLDEYFGKRIEIRVVDTGGAFKGKGLTRMDLCCANKEQSELDIINRSHLFIAIAGSDWT